jgi:hypothetical protein
MSRAHSHEGPRFEEVVHCISHAKWLIKTFPSPCPSVRTKIVLVSKIACKLPYKTTTNSLTRKNSGVHSVTRVHQVMLTTSNCIVFCFDIANFQHQDALSVSNQVDQSDMERKMRLSSSDVVEFERKLSTSFEPSNLGVNSN